MKKILFVFIAILLIIVSNTKVLALTMADLGENPFNYQLTHENPLGEGVHNILLYNVPGPNTTDFTWDSTDKKDFKGLLKYCPDDNCSSDRFIDTFIVFAGNDFAAAYPDTNSNGKTGIHTTEGFNKYKNNLEQILINMKNAAIENNIKINIMLGVAIYKSDKMVPGLESTPTSSQINVLADYVENMAADLYDVYDLVDDGTHLNLVGFYWANESIYGGEKSSSYANYFTLEEEAMKKFNSWAHNSDENSLGRAFKTLWIPYMAPNGEQNKGDTFGFDYVSLQTGQAFRDPVDNYDDYYTNVSTGEYNTYLSYTDRLSNKQYRLDLATEIANRKGFGIEFESNYRPYKRAKAYNRLMEWLTWSFDYNNWGQQVNVFYSESLHRINSSKRHGNTLFHRDMYDLTYKYATGKLTRDDVSNLAKGKNYTTSPSAYTSGDNSQVYFIDVSGHELTDGVFANEDYGTEWIALRKADTDNDTFSATVDLGQVYNGVYKFISEFRDYESAGISKPSKVEVYYSTDNTNWKSFGTMTLVNYDGDSRYLARFAGNPVSARYIKFEITPGEKTLVFMSEMQVYRKNTVTLSERESVEYSLDDEGVINLTNEGGNLRVSSSDESVATASIENGKLHINPVSEGNATITVTELRYNSYTTLDVTVRGGGNPTETPGGEEPSNPGSGSGGGAIVPVPDTLSMISPFSTIMAIISIGLGIGFFIYAHKRLD